MAWRELIEPLQRIRLVAGAQFVEPIGSIGELRQKRRGDFRTDFVTAATDGRTNRGDKFARPRSKLHFHASDGFFHDARERASPAGMHSGNGAVARIRQENRNAVSRLNGKQQPWHTCDGRIAAAGFIGHTWKFANEVGMELFQGHQGEVGASNGLLKAPAILVHIFSVVPIGEADVEHFVFTEDADSATRRAEAMYKPRKFGERGHLQDGYTV